MYHRNKPTKDDLIDLVRDNGPYSYFATLALMKPRGGEIPSLAELIAAVNHLVSYLNRQIFGSKGKKRDKSICGFCSIEDHKTGGHHVHLLIAYDEALFVEGKPLFTEHFINGALTLRRYNPKSSRHDGPPLTNRENIDCSYIRRDDTVNQKLKVDREASDLARYILKETNKPLVYRGRRYERLYILGPVGISLTAK